MKTAFERFMTSLLICVLVVSINGDVNAFKIGIPGISPGIHENITQRALGFLKPEILTSIVEGNRAVDLAVIREEVPSILLKLPDLQSSVPSSVLEEPTSSAAHFDNCQFLEGSNHINGLYQSIIRSYIVGEENRNAYYWFGQLLHTSQDIYAHSNWVELGNITNSDLISSGYGDWILQPFNVLDGDVLILEGTDQTIKEHGYNIVGRKDNIFTLETQTLPVQTFPGLVTGTYGKDGGCPPSTSIPHGVAFKVSASNNDGWKQGDLNKDMDRPEQGDLYEQASHLAVLQTKHEWCRLLSLVVNDPLLTVTAGNDIINSWVTPNQASRKEALKGCPDLGLTFAPLPVIYLATEPLALFNSLIQSAGGSTDYTFTNVTQRDAQLIDGVTLISAPKLADAQLYCVTVAPAVTTFAITSQNASVRAPIIVASGFAPNLLTAFYTPTYSDQLTAKVTENRFAFVNRGSGHPWEIYPASVVWVGWDNLCGTK